MERRIVLTVLSAAALVLLVCPSCDHDNNSPEPNSLTFHKHVVVLHLSATNRASDTIGIQSVTSGAIGFDGEREKNGRLSRDYASFDGSVRKFQLVYPDTLVHACTASIQHFVGYQTRYGGDTTRIGQLDGYGVWHVDLLMLDAKVILQSGETAGVDIDRIQSIPDTVRQSGVLDLDVTFDIDGLLARESGSARYRMNTDRVRIQQR